ncbi:MAG: HNH endonuclease, partial [Bacteroidetes bacterium]|nr:HNH endonuclease [Bacteroidota bacterium]
WNKGTKGIMKPNNTSFKKGQKSWNWKGCSKTGSGYVEIKQPSHFRANKRGYVRQHILVAEEALNRFLEPEETIHHINEIRDDNSLENLYLFESVTAHKRYHMLLRYNKCKRIVKSNLI